MQCNGCCVGRETTPPLSGTAAMLLLMRFPGSQLMDAAAHALPGQLTHGCLPLGVQSQKETEGVQDTLSKPAGPVSGRSSKAATNMSKGGSAGLRQQSCGSGDVALTCCDCNCEAAVLGQWCCGALFTGLCRHRPAL